MPSAAHWRWRGLASAVRGGSRVTGQIWPSSCCLRGWTIQRSPNWPACRPVSRAGTPIGWCPACTRSTTCGCLTRRTPSWSSEGWNAIQQPRARPLTLLNPLFLAFPGVAVAAFVWVAPYAWGHPISAGTLILIASTWFTGIAVTGLSFHLIGRIATHYWRPAPGWPRSALLSRPPSGQVREAPAGYGYKLRWTRSASSSSAMTVAGSLPACLPTRSTATDRICSACAFESCLSPV